MKAFLLKKFGAPEKAFELAEVEKPAPDSGEILVKVEAFGLNFADVTAMQGLYMDCPPLPCVIGYEVVGHVEAMGADVDGFKIGDRVVSLTRFGAFAEYAVADHRAAVVIDEEMDYCFAAAIATQFSTAYFCSQYLTQLHPGEKVLIQAAAGGVGTALVQIAKLRGCEVFGTASSAEKLDYLRSLGVDHPINYLEQDYAAYIESKIGKQQLDVVFDSLGGKDVKKARKLLARGTGRVICYGVGSRSGKGRFFWNDLKLVFGFGFMATVELLLKSQGVTGVNMLRVADNKPEALQMCMKAVYELIRSGQIKPTIGGKFERKDLVNAVTQLKSRATIGKLAVKW